LAVLVPTPASAANSADAWMSARQVHVTHAMAIGEAATGMSDGGSAREIRQLRRVVAAAVRAIDGLEVHACFRVWWSYVRSSYVLYDQALAGVESNDVARTQSGVMASRYMGALAAATQVDCPRDEAVLPGGTGLDPRDGLPLVNAMHAMATSAN
jgi:hypothetical protein